MDVSFSERLSNIMALQNLLSFSTSTGRLNAKELEESAHQKAKSKVVQPLEIRSRGRASDLTLG